MTNLAGILPEGIEMWSEPWQAAAVFVATFILEDLATVGAGLLLSAGSLGWPAAMVAAFFGVWLGDIGLYAVARGAGRRWFERRDWFQRFNGRIWESERWFAEKGSSILLVSRCVPGARLPTYLAAGFLRVPLPGFLAVTGASSLIWTVGVLAVTQLLGRQILSWLSMFKQGALALAIGMGVMLLLLRLVRGLVGERTLAGAAAGGIEVGSPVIRLDSAIPGSGDGAELSGPDRWRPTLRQRIGATAGRWLRWEFWPAWLFYPPVVLWCGWLMLKHRGIRLPTVANPGIFSGGIVGESKMATLAELMASCPVFTAEAELIRGGSVEERLSFFREFRERHGLGWPVILKPDTGQRGVGVKLIRSDRAAMDYFRQTNAPIVVQRYVRGPHELGVFYCRFPHERRGRIFSITEKQFPVLHGDGESTVEELMWKDARARLIVARYLSRLGANRSRVPEKGQEIRLVEAGNHAQGCVFVDGGRLLTPELQSRIDEISQMVPGFFVGRYDLRYESEDELRAGRGFHIIELNGAASESTNIYDARNSLWAAYRTLFRQWEIVFAIGAANRARGFEPTPFGEFWRRWRQFVACSASYPAAD